MKTQLSRALHNTIFTESCL